MKFTFKIGESIKKAWGLYKENFGSMFLMFLVILTIQILSQFLSRSGHNSVYLSLVLAIVSIFISYIWMKSVLGLLDGKGFNPFAKSSLPNWAQIWDFIKTNILIALCVVPIFMIPAFLIGIVFAFSVFSGATTAMNFKIFLIMIPIFILSLIPAIYISSRLFPAKYLSIEKFQGARKSIKEAWGMTRGHGWIITWKIILIGLFMVLGFIALFVGSIVTYPLGIIVLTMMYRYMLNSTNNSEILNTEESPKIEIKEEIIVEKVEEVTPEIAK